MWFWKPRLSPSVSSNLGSICVMRVVKDNYWYFKPAFHVPQQCLYPLPLLAPLCLISIIQQQKNMQLILWQEIGNDPITSHRACSNCKSSNCIIAPKLCPHLLTQWQWESKNLVSWSRMMKTGILWIGDFCTKESSWLRLSLSCCWME